MIIKVIWFPLGNIYQGISKKMNAFFKGGLQDNSDICARISLRRGRDFLVGYMASPCVLETLC